MTFWTLHGGWPGPGCGTGELPITSDRLHIFKLRNFTLKNFDLIIRTIDEAHVKNGHGHSTKFLLSYNMIKNIWNNFDQRPKLIKGNINQVQYSCVSQFHTVQQLHTNSIICVHKFKKFSKFSYNQHKFEKVLKKVQFKSTELENFQKSSTQVRPQ